MKYGPDSEVLAGLANVADGLVGQVELKVALRAFRRAMFNAALVKSKSNRSAAARMLGVNRRYVQKSLRAAVVRDPVEGG